MSEPQKHATPQWCPCCGDFPPHPNPAGCIAHLLSELATERAYSHRLANEYRLRLLALAEVAALATPNTLAAMLRRAAEGGT